MLEPGEKRLHRRLVALGMQGPECQQVVRDRKRAWDRFAAARNWFGFARLGLMKHALDLILGEPPSGLDLLLVHWFPERERKTRAQAAARELK